MDIASLQMNLPLVVGIVCVFYLLAPSRVRSIRKLAKKRGFIPTAKLSRGVFSQLRHFYGFDPERNWKIKTLVGGKTGPVETYIVDYIPEGSGTASETLIVSLIDDVSLPLMVIYPRHLGQPECELSLGELLNVIPQEFGALYHIAGTNQSAMDRLVSVEARKLFLAKRPRGLFAHGSIVAVLEPNRVLSAREVGGLLNFAEELNLILLSRASAIRIESERRLTEQGRIE